MVPRWPGEPSRFAEIGVTHLPRPAVGKLSRLWPSTLWYYLERSLFAFMSAGLALGEGLRARWPAAVYVRDTVAAYWWATTLGPALRIPVVYEAHDLESTNPSRAKEAWAQGLVRGLDRGALQQSTLVASLTEDFRRLLAEKGWRAAEDVVVIPDAFDGDQFFAGDRGAARRELGIGEGAPLVVYAGLTFSYRRLDLLVSAFASVRLQRPDALLVFVGGRPAEILALRDQARERGLEDAVHLLGPRSQPEVRSWLQAADVLVIPDTVTDVTASPLKLFEYLAVERAVVLPDIPALREVLPESIGYYFRRGDLKALAGAVLEALEDPARPARERAGREAVRPHTYGARAERILAAAHRASERGC